MMNLRIRRRRFGQLAIASAVTTAIANLAGKGVAQQPSEIIYGVRLGSTGGNLKDPANITPSIVLTSLDIATGKDVSNVELPETEVSNRERATESRSKAVFNQPSERITGFTILPNGTFVMAALAETQNGQFNRLKFTDSSQQGLKLSGFRKSNSSIESLLATKENQLISIVSLNQGTPPFEFANINIKTGILDSGIELGLPLLKPLRRYSNLAQHPDGTIHATTIGSEGTTLLVKLDLVNRSILTGRGKFIILSQLKFDNQFLRNDLLSLAISPSGQLFALADPNYEKTNSLFLIDAKTGEMKLLRKFAVDKIAFARS